MAITNSVRNQKSKGKIKTGSEQTQTSKTITGRVRCHGGLSILSWKAIIIHGIFVQKQTNKQTNRKCPFKGSWIIVRRVLLSLAIFSAWTFIDCHLESCRLQHRLSQNFFSCQRLNHYMDSPFLPFDTNTDKIICGNR